MPIYEYEHNAECGETCRDPFEILQSIGDAPLNTCPVCNLPCRRVFSAFGVSGGEKGLLSQTNLEKHGFTQYKRASQGHYEKSAGPGPKHIVRE